MLQVDVVVVGAGATGLTAANAVQAAGREVMVLEARDRVGGRLWTNPIEGVPFEIGGQWVSPGQDALVGLIEELGLETFPRYRDGDGVYISRAGELRRFRGDELPLGADAEAEFEKLVAEFEKLVAEVDPDAPWDHPAAEELDSITFDSWLRARASDGEVVDNIAMYISSGMLTKPPHAFSLLQAMHMAASAGGFAALLDADTLLDRRVVGGLQRVPERLAERLKEPVRLSTPVRRIEWEEGSVVVHADDLVVRAKQVLLAVPPSVYGTVEYSPPLPRQRMQLEQHLSMGFVIKVHAQYEHPFWRDAGLSGTAFSPYRLVREIYDNTSPGGSQGTLVAFVADCDADAAFEMNADARRARILEDFVEYLGPEAGDPIVYYESDWGSEEWTRGAYAASFSLGGLSRYGRKLAEPIGPIRYASSDVPGEGYQHVDGAVRMGRTAAAAILAALER